MAMIEYRGRYIMIISPSQGEDLKRSVTEEDWAQWDLEAEWDNMFYGGSLDE